jgi:phosphotransacetylase
LGNQKRRGISLLDAQKLMRERNYFAAMMVNEEADGLVTGYTRSYSSVVKPMLQLIGKAQDRCYYKYDVDKAWTDVLVRYRHKY